ncbi:uncharacterized protein CPUR_05375 [Claviceps purpurea 20.1]|uniref:Uncharacterized protein n=1 Tax=Claviceps purpurea (strain 20.1) TaxID=1111077 RepID=M1VWM3_CLAP2|nr:uncharacterized protein CPUR_05375 [Claviceps purpurea 20.1]
MKAASNTGSSRHNTDTDATITTNINININRMKTISIRIISIRVINNKINNTRIINNRNITTRPLNSNISITQTSINHIKITRININQIHATQIKVTKTCMEQPKTAIELARRSEPKQEFLPEDHAENVDAYAANAPALFPSNQMSSSLDNTLLTPVFLDGGPTVPLLPPDGADNSFAINAPLLDYRDMLLGSGPDIDIQNWYTMGWDAGTMNGGSTRQDLIEQQGGDIIDLTMTSGLPPVECWDMAMARLPKDSGETGVKESAPVRMRRVRKGLAELETCLRAHVKDQLLQMRECH